MTYTKEQYIRKCLETAMRLFKENSSYVSSIYETDNIECVVNTKYRVCAGSASIKKGKSFSVGPIKYKIQIASFVLEKASTEELYETVSHELAHIVDYRIRDIMCHDMIWIDIHKRMGGSGKSRHTINGIQSNTKKVFIIKHVNTNKEYTISNRKLKRLINSKDYIIKKELAITSIMTNNAWKKHISIIKEYNS